MSIEKTRSKNKIIGHYTLSKTLGEGTFGKVKLGTHNLTRERVAVKILEKRRIVDVSDIERVTREIHILKLIRHPNIIQLYEIIETPRQLYLIMEYANGGELFDYIVANTRVKEKEACKFYQQLLSGIEYIHKLGVVHRDLKPENLLLDQNKNIKIVDFGLSNTYKEGELLKTACGSPCYAAPEMIAGKEYNPYKADIWSCGVILFALICGYLPFEDPNTSKLYKKILGCNYQCPEFISEDSIDLLSKILDVEPETRLDIDQIRQHNWMQQAHADSKQGIMVGYDPILVDENIINMLQNYSLDVTQARRCVESNKHNHLSTAYYLLLKKHIENGGHVAADMSVERIDPRSFNNKNQSDYKITPHPPIPFLSFDTGFNLAALGKNGALRKQRPGSTINENKLPEKINEKHIRNQSTNNSMRVNRLNVSYHKQRSPRLSFSRIISVRSKVPEIKKKSRTSSCQRVKSPHPPQIQTAQRLQVRNRRLSPFNKTETRGLKVNNGYLSFQTTKQPSEILQEITQQMNKLGVLFKITKQGRIKCKKKTLNFIMDVCRSDIRGRYQINVKRMAGDLWEFKKFCNFFAKTSNI